MDKNTKKFAIGTTIAAAGGYLAGILTAPKSGKDTRKDVKDSALKAKHDAEKELKKLHSEVTTQLNRAKDNALNFKSEHKPELDKIVSTAVAAKEKAKHMLTNIHDGGTEDKDLNIAIKEINEAVSHLKKYLDKVVTK